MASFLFDVGKVLLDFDFERSLAQLLPAAHPAPAAALGRLLDKKDEFETGAIDASDYVEWALATLESKASPAQFVAAWRNIFTPNLPMWQSVRSLHEAGHRLILFSNTNSLHHPWFLEQWPECFALFSGEVISYQIGHIKPETAFYSYALDHFGLVSNETYYIDDLAANIATGKKLGFHCHTYELCNHAAFESWLNEKTQHHNHSYASPRIEHLQENTSL